MGKRFENMKTVIGLKPGDIVSSKFNSETYIITANYGDHATGVSTIDITNPDEWQVMRSDGGVK